MSDPLFTIKLSETTRGGSLLSSSILHIRGVLLRGGFILLPSDTCYAIAALAKDKAMHDKINILLDRQKMPISLAFPNFQKVAKWADLNVVSAVLLETFTPGPITVVCKAKTIVPEDFTTRVIRSNDRTVGVRIPDSLIEREVANCTKYPVTTVAVRDPRSGDIVQDLDNAIEIVSRGMNKIGDHEWGAIEGREFYAKHSTVVRVTSGAQQLELIREGDIPFDDIKSVSKNLPIWAIEDWP